VAETCGNLFENNNPALFWGGPMETMENLIWKIQCSCWDSNRSYVEPLTLIGSPHCLLVHSVINTWRRFRIRYFILKITVFIFVTPYTQKHLDASGICILFCGAGVATGLLAGRSRNQTSIPALQDFSLLLSVQTGSGSNQPVIRWVPGVK
jgi:hypothetical protein